MSLINFIKQCIPNTLKQKLRHLTPKERLYSVLANSLPAVKCVDVGASYYPHAKWRLFLQSPRTQWAAVEPNAYNLSYIQTWPYHSSVEVVNAGLSEHGGSQTLFVTNVDSGSSLLEPKIAESMRRRITNLDYFYPVQRKTIKTLTLDDVLSTSHSDNLPIFVKLDTQGTELAILKGARKWLEAHNIVGIEMESTLQANPVMSGAGKFWQACDYFESLGYELLDIKPIYGPSRFGKNLARSKTFLNECDAVFALRQDVVAKKPVEYRIALMAFYICNQFYEEALSLLDEDVAVQKQLNLQGCSLTRLRAVMNFLR